LLLVKIIIIFCFYSPDGSLSSEHFSDHYTGPSLLSDDIFDQVDELFEGSDEDKLKAYEILVNLNEEVNQYIFILLLSIHLPNVLIRLCSVQTILRYFGG